MLLVENKNITTLNLHAALLTLAQNIVQVFGVVYFLKQGFTIPLVLGGWALFHLFRLIFRPFAFKIIYFIGLKKGVILGTLLYSTIGIFLSVIHGPDYLFFIFLAYLALCDVFYWFAFHTYFAVMGDGNHRGQEVCTRESLLLLAGAFAPAIGGILIQYTSFLFASIIAACSTIIAAIPVFYGQEASIGKQMTFNAALKDHGANGFKLWFGWSILYHMFPFTWSIVMFFMAGSFALFGGLLSLEILFSVFILTLVGSMIDKGKQRNILLISVLLVAFVALMRVFVVNTLYLIIASQFLMALAMSTFRPVLITNFYSYCKKSQNKLWYTLFGEWGWDIGAIISLSTAALLVANGLQLKYIMLLSFFGLTINYIVLSKMTEHDGDHKILTHAHLHKHHP